MTPCSDGPKRVEPVFTKHLAGPWLKLSVEIPEIKRDIIDEPRKC